MTESIAAAAATLIEARRANTHLDALPADQKPATMADAYAIQQKVVSDLQDPGAEFGFKIGATNEKAQALLGAEEPFYAELIPALTVSAPHTVNAADLPMIGRAGVRLQALPGCGRYRHLGRGEHRRDRRDGRRDRDRRNALSRVDQGRRREPVADNGAHGLWIKGETASGWQNTDLAAADHADRQQRETATGTGANVLGHPLDSLAWLANKLIADGRKISAGQYDDGFCHPVFPASAGQEIVADFGAFGKVAVTIK